MPTAAKTTLNQNLEDVDRLMEFHLKEAGTSPGRKYGLEVLNKSSIVLITSYWEAYCEDVCAELLGYLATKSISSDKLPENLRKRISLELKSDKHELSVWTVADEKWRLLIKRRLDSMKEERNRRFNTPKSNNIDALFSEALGIEKISDSWKWDKKMTIDRARKKLDKFVTLRGEIAHRGKTSESVTKNKVKDFQKFVVKLSDIIEDKIAAFLDEIEKNNKPEMKRGIYPERKLRR